MELYQIEYFLAAAKYLNFTKAAEAINVSQPSLSIQIKRLETELGVQLFVRTARSLVLTVFGNEFIPYAERIMKEIKDAKVLFEQYISADKGHISLGAFNGSQYFGFIDIISKFVNTYPNINFSMRQAECFEILSMLMNYEIDVAFLSDYNEAEGIIFYPLYNDYVVILFERDHPLANRKSVSLDEIVEYPLICHEKTTINQNTMDAFKKIGLNPNIALQIDGPLPTILGLVSSGIGATMVSSKVAKYYEHLGLATLKIEPTINRSTYLAISAANKKRPIIHNFVEFVLQHFGNDSKK